MSRDSLALRTARGHVDNYQTESTNLMARHAEAMDCRDCEAFLQLGIDAFEWLMRADREYRAAMAAGQIDYNAEVDAALTELCRTWLKPCEYAQKWIALQKQRNYEIDNLAEFNNCCEEMRAIVAAEERLNQANALPTAIATLREEAVQEHSRGETTEFV